MSVAQLNRADDSAHMRPTYCPAAERGQDGRSEHLDPCSRRLAAAHGDFEPLTETCSCSRRLPAFRADVRPLTEISSCSRRCAAAHRDFELLKETSSRSPRLAAVHGDLQPFTEMCSRSRKLRAAQGNFELLTRTSQAPRALLAVGAPPAGPPPSIPGLDSSVGSQCSPRSQTDSEDRRRCRRRELDPARTRTRGGSNFGGEHPRRC